MQPVRLWPPIDAHLRAHLVGICGAGMKALAEFLFDRGWHVTGCDGDPDPDVARGLANMGIEVLTGHSEDHLQFPPKLLIYSAAVTPENIERKHARELGIPQISYVDALSELTTHADTLAIAGTHGKSTTTAMLGAILQSAGRSPSVICGAELLGLKRSGWAGESSTLVVEACEFRKHFTNLSPHIACLLGIEADHFDCYPTLASAEVAYREFAERLQDDGVLIVRSDCPATLHAMKDLPNRRITFSLTDAAADWQAVNRRIIDTKIVFQLQHHETISSDLSLSIPGLHNVQNALAAAACAADIGLTLPEIAAGLQEFRGLKRRFEIQGQWRGSPIVDDYAHHPTEIRATLTTARQVFPQRRIICLFQPHQLSRTAALLPEFASALSLADFVYLLPVYAAREMAGEQQKLLTDELLSKLTVPSGLISTLDQVWGTVQTDAGTDAVILTLGAGTLSRVHHDHIH